MKTILNPREIFKKNIYLIILLICANILVQISVFCFDHDYVFGLVPLFDVNAEQSVPTFYSAVALLVCSFLLITITFKQKELNNPYKLWAGLSFIFLLLSIDEIASFHEGLTMYVREVFFFSGLLYYAWIIPYGLAVLIFALVYLRFILRLPKKIMFLFILSGFLCVLGALGLEAFGGWQHELNGYEGNLLYVVLYTIEEFLEMMGIAIFIYTLLTYISIEFGSLVISLSKEEDKTNSVIL